MLDKRITNSLWMASEKLLQIAGVFIVTAAMAKYIGPYYYGVISYFSAVFSLIYIFCAMGADPIVIKKGSINPIIGAQRSIFISLIRTIFYIFISILFLFYFFLSGREYNHVIVIFLLSIFLSQLISSFDFISLVNNFNLNSKINTISNVMGLLIAISLRYLMVYMKIDIIYFSIPIVISPLTSNILKIAFSKINISFLDVKVYFKRKVIIATLNTLKPFAITNISANVYLKLPLLCVSIFLGYKQAGIYSCASTIATTWVFFPMAIISSYIPKFYRSNQKESRQYLSQLILALTIICFFIILFLCLVSKYIIIILYGSDYLGANNIVLTMALCSYFSVVGTLLYHYLIKDKAYKYIMSRTFLCALCSIPITIYLVKKFDIEGAVYSLLFIEILSVAICNLFYKNALLIRLVVKSFSVANLKQLKNL